MNTMRTRRFLPSISLLSAFDAVARTGSTAAAARELDLSQSTVSRLIQNLEGQIGCALFQRQRQRLITTEPARAYARDIARALDLIQRASTQVSTNPGGGVLSLAILPAFGTRWLAPRLGSFLGANPGITVNLATRLRRFNFEAESFDAAIHFGRDDWQDAGHLKLFDETVTACASPAFIMANNIRTVSDLARVQLLQLETRRKAWNAWFKAHEHPSERASGMLFDQFATMTQSAIAGLGVALLPDYLADLERDEGRLVPLFRRSIATGGSYWLVWPLSRSDYIPLAAFRNWLAPQFTGGRHAVSFEDGTG
jgi:LysR family transcriptional regulator, glycine cleavage system transcriptional activator